MTIKGETFNVEETREYEDVVFEDCVFNGINIKAPLKFHNCEFNGCEFTDIDFSNLIIVDDMTTYFDCEFSRCAFIWYGDEEELEQEEDDWTYPEYFINCRFYYCVMRELSFYQNYFMNCFFYRLVVGEGVEWVRCVFKGCSFDESTIGECWYDKVQFHGNEFRDTSINRGEFSYDVEMIGNIFYDDCYIKYPDELYLKRIKKIGNGVIFYGSEEESSN